MKNLSRRRLLRNVAMGAAISSHGFVDVARAKVVGPPTPSPTNILLVGNGGDFRDLRDAVTFLQSAPTGQASPTVIQLLPGVYDADIELATLGLTLRGSGSRATILEGSGAAALRLNNHNITVESLGIRVHTTNGSEAAITSISSTLGVYLSDLRIEVTGPGAAVQNMNWSSYEAHDLRVITEGVGIDTRGFFRVYGLNLSLFGYNSGWPHIGVRHKGGRFWCFGGWVGTGYQSDYDGLARVDYEVFGADDPVVGFWIPDDANDNTRLQLYNVESFCRNEDTIVPALPVNCVRLEGSGAWARLFSCMMQAETPSNWNLTESIWNSTDSKVESYGSRITSINGDTFGGAALGVQTFSVSNDGFVMDKWEGGLHRCDASDGPFTIKLVYKLNAPQRGIGEDKHFVKVDNTSHPVIIDLNGSTLEGESANPSLNAQWNKLSIVWDGYSWIRT